MWRPQRIFAPLLIISVVVFGNPATTLLAEEAASGADGASTPAVETPAPAPAETTTPPAETTTPAETPSGDATVTTGDAVAGTDTTTTANTNTTTVDPDATPTTSTENTTETPAGDSGSGGGSGVGGGGGSAVGSGGYAPTDFHPVQASTTVTTTNNNNATASTSANVAAETGNNTASSTSNGGNATVNSGNSYAFANVVNILNTNIFNSQGFFVFLNSFFGGGTLNLSSLSFMQPAGGPEGTTYCSLGGCEGNDAQYVMINNNNATIDNAVVVRAGSGGNTATAGNGNATVNTGDAYAAANVVNVANTNFVDSNYLLLSFNNFGDMNGDIVLPSSDFFSHLFGSGSTVKAGSSQSVSNNNSATINNDVGASANSGNNSASAGNGNASVSTGNANANGGVTNVVNTNEVGGTTVFLLFRVFGDWAGNIFNAPPGIEWAETDHGVTLFSTEPGNGGGSALDNLAVTSNSTAGINNKVQVYALTGDNKAESSNGSATVNTGNAYAAANVFNIANTNVVGRNWIFAIFNIFGNWNGNISFGQPNLWIGAVAEPKTTGLLISGTEVEYHFTVTNRGQSPASNVHLKVDYNHDHLAFDGGPDWSLGTLAAGQTVEIVKTATLVNLPLGDTALPVIANVTLHETDANPADNKEEVTVVGQNYVTGGSFGAAEVSGIPGSAGYLDPVWNISKTVSDDSTVASSTVDYTIVVTNDGAPAYNATLFDTVTDEDNNIIFEQSWDLGTVQRTEEITVTYSVFFHENIPPGVYTNHAFIKSESRNPQKGKGVPIDSKVATAKVTIEGERVASSIPPEERSCGQYLFGSIKAGEKNDASEVTKLQKFLATFGNFTNVQATGVYDKQTQDAVRLFQESHKDEVLSPWGLSGPTGYVYITTRKKINDIYCQGITNFPLTNSDTNEISTYRSYITSLRAASQILKKDRPAPKPAVSTANAVETTDADENGSDKSTTTIIIENVKESATNTSAAVINASHALGAMVTTTTNALEDLKGWFGVLPGAVKNIFSSFKDKNLKIFGNF